MFHKKEKEKTKDKRKKKKEMAKLYSSLKGACSPPNSPHTSCFLHDIVERGDQNEPPQIRV
jgi:hypothetical protein